MLDRLGVGTSSPQKMQSFFPWKSSYYAPFSNSNQTPLFPEFIHRYYNKALCLMKYSSRTLKNLLHFTYKKTHLVFVDIDLGTFCWAQISYFWRVNYRTCECDRLIFKRNNKLVSIPGYVLQSCQELCARDQVFLSRLISRSHKLNPANMALFVWNCRSRFSET